MYSRHSIEREKHVNLSCSNWVPDKRESIVLIVHGLGEHSQRYEKVAKALNEAGSAVFSFDLRGHGESSGIRGHIGSYRTTFEDIDAVGCRAREIAGQLPLFIYGHSLGGGIVLAKRLQKDSGYAGYITTSPWLKLVNPPSPLLSSAVRYLRPIVPSLSINSNLDADMLSSDKNVVDKYRNDPLVHGKISIGTASDAMELGKKVLDNADVTNSNLFLAHGSYDSIVSVEASRQLSKSSNGSVTYLEMPGKHELHNEPHCFEGLINGIVAFIADKS